MFREKDTFISKSPEETIRFGQNLGQKLKPPAFVGLIGPLGSGKTLLAKAIASGMGHDAHEVHSPSFTLMNIYEGRRRLYHFDFYRLDQPKDFEGLGLEEFFDDPHAVVVVEWAEKVKPLVPDYAIMVHLEFGKSETERRIRLEASGERIKKLLKGLVPCHPGESRGPVKSGFRLPPE